ncbi:MAG: hypothetical protein HZA81_03420 [Candidatus Taylorbacteria bacterium]|nr:hypothetical protein [Candidatus Taylorbacteria bacterium]
MKKHNRRLLLDGIVVAVSIAVAIAIAKSPYIDLLVSWTDGYYVLTAFVAGLFFTSAFTTAPAIAVLAKLSLAYPPGAVAIIGGIGALLGDLLIFAFIKGHIREDVRYFLAKAKTKRIRHILEHRFARWSLAFVGAIIIASPLPDELGLAMMGLSDVRTSRFVPISLAFNTLGILLIAFIAHSI